MAARIAAVLLALLIGVLALCIFYFLPNHRAPQATGVASDDRVLVDDSRKGDP
jgi:hypothetical protein